MKIIFISGLYSPYIGGGAEISNKLLVEGLNKANTNIEVITLGEKNVEEKINGVLVKRMFINNITKKYLENIKLRKTKVELIEKIQRILYKIFCILNRNIYKQIDGKLKESNGDILHTSSINLFFPILWWKIAKKNKMKVIHTLRDPYLIYFRGFNSKNKIINILDKFNKKIYHYYLNKYVDYIHSPSEYMINFHKNSGFNFNKSVVIPNTITIESINVVFKSKEIDVLYVGNISKQKGVETLVTACKNNIKCIFVGDGELKEKLLINGITVTGWLEEKKVLEYMQKSKILVLPSEWEEAFGRVLIEGIASGSLVIGSDQGAIPEVLNYDERYIFKAKSVSSLSEKIDRILALSEEEYKEELNYLQKYIEKFNYDNHIKQFKEFYCNILSEENGEDVL
ncbi:MAG: glycosyltransferase [Fusobacteriaceae bacterium]|jgi:glycosyltransferase involved in cell wall biosynthesis|nr:glycosyltransferase [Fusobacteriaceae bacterium]